MVFCGVGAAAGGKVPDERGCRQYDSAKGGGGAGQWLKASVPPRDCRGLVSIEAVSRSSRRIVGVRGTGDGLLVRVTAAD